MDIRFRRVGTKHGSKWFAMVRNGANLKLNGQRFPSAVDFVVGPLPPFSIVEYDGRVIFLYVGRRGVDYIPKAVSPRAQEGISRIVQHLGVDTDQTTHVSRNEISDVTSKLRIQPEQQPNDVDDCKYFEWRMKEWTMLKCRSNVQLEDMVKDAQKSFAEWLLDTVVFRAIASVTTAIELENGVGFAQISELGSQVARNPHLPYVNTLVGPGQEFFLPFNTDSQTGIHWLLLHIRNTSTGPEVNCYNSGKGTYEDAIMRTVINTGWCDRTAAEQTQPLRIVNRPCAQQPAAWECGYFTILNSWCLALGMTPSTKSTKALSMVRVQDVINMINLSMSGFMDSATIQSFMRCVGFVDAGFGTIANDRHFTRSVPFLSKYSMDHYVRMRQSIDLQPASTVNRLNSDTMRYLLEHTGSTGVHGGHARLILQDFDKWLHEQDLKDYDNDSHLLIPLSPISPAAIRLAFERVADFGLWRIPRVLPADDRDLRKMWNVYHRSLRAQDMLTSVRATRAEQKRGGNHTTQELVDRDDVNYPYDDPRVIVLDRLGMLPSQNVLSADELAAIRGTRPTLERLPVKLRLRLGRKFRS
jgi:hypothetical protein